MKYLNNLFFFSLLCTAMINNDLMAQLPKVSHGKIERITSFSYRTVDVWLPEDYPSAGKYGVLYLQDGQMLFDSTQTWNKQEWGIDEEVGRLMKSKIIRPCIVVGIWNAGEGRHSEYFPQKPVSALSSEKKKVIVNANDLNGRPVSSDAYLKFIVKELKPYIEKTYKVYSDASHNFIGGSSMGGLISLYAICEYPGVFGGAACLSTHWPGLDNMESNPFPAAMFEYLSSHLPDPATHRIYFDHGTETLDSLYPPFQIEVDSIMKARGYDDSNWKTIVFPGDDHSEIAWRRRLHIPLTFLMK